MGQQFRIQRLIGTIPVVEGQAATMDLPRGYDYESLHLRLTGNLNVTVAGAAVRAEAPCQAIARAEIIADGRNTLFSAPYWYTVFAKYDRAANQNGARFATPPSGFAIAAYAIEANGVIDFMTADGERPKDSNFRSNGLQLLQLRLTFGTAASLLTGAPTANFVAGTVVEVYASEMVELPDPAGNVTSPTALKKISFQEIAIPASNVNQEIRLPAGNLIKSCVLRTEGNVTAGEPSTTILNKAQLASGVDVRTNLSGGAIRGKNNNDFGYILPGLYIFDLARNGSAQARLSELWDVTKQAEPKISMDVVGGANVKAQIVVAEYLGLK